MNFLSSLSSAVLSASFQALSNATSTGIPGVNGYTLGDRVTDYDGKSIWTLYSGIKRDDQSKVSIFQFESQSPSSQGQGDRRQLLPLAKNAFRKLRSTRHPNILKFLDGAESESSVWIITEPVEPLSNLLDKGTGISEESKVYGLLHLVTGLGFLNQQSGSVHGGVRKETTWVTKGGEWKLGGFEVCSKLEEHDAVMWNFGGLLPDSRYHASPEVRKGGWTSLKEYDPSVYDSYLLHLLIFQLFNGPLPNSYLSPSSSSETPSLPQTRGSIPPALFQPWRRLGNPNPLARLKTSAFLELGNSTSDAGGWWTNNRLVKLSTALEGFSLASDNEKATLIRTLKAISSSQQQQQTTPSTPHQMNGTSTSTSPLPTGFLLYKILPSLLHTFEFSSSSSSSLLPLILSLSTSLSPTEYSTRIIPPLLRMFQVPDRAMRMALLEGLEVYGDKLTSKEVVEKVWPYLITGFGDLVPVIREATVKSILIIAPKLNDRILNNDLLRYLSKTQTDSEPGIRTNTCILLSRLSPHLSLSTQRKVLIPAFARSLRDPFVHARIAGLMSLMAGLEGWEKEDLAGKVIPSVGICLVDKEKSVRDQGFRAIDMFVRKCEVLTASMPETAISPEMPPSPASSVNVNGTNVPSTQSIGLATNAAGAGLAIASWGFASISKKLSSAELAAPIERRVSTPHLPPSSPNPPSAPPTQASTSTPSLSVPGGFAFDSGNASASAVGGTSAVKEDWGGDLMDVNDDTEDWDEFETGQLPSQSNKPRIDPLAARLSASRPPSSSLRGKKGSMRLGGASKSSALRVPMDMDATDSWDLDLNESPAASTKGVKPKPAPSLPPQSTIPRVSAPSSRSTPIHSRTQSTVSPSPIVPVPTPTPSIKLPLPFSSQPPLSEPLRSPLPPLSTPPLAPIPPTSSTVPSPLPVPTEPIIPISPPPSQVNESRPTTPALPASPALSASSASVPIGVLSKEEKAAKMAAAREERRKRMAAAKAK